MGNWKYVGFSRDGVKQVGSLVAKNEREARSLLRQRGIRAKKLTPPSILETDLAEWMVAKGLSKPFGVKELSHFTKQMAIMVSAGVPLMETLEILFKSQRHPVLKRVIRHIANDISGGKTMAEAMVKQKGFNKLYCSLVKAGETGGILDTILNKISEQMENQQKLKSKVKGAMMYPTIVVVVGVGVIWAMMVFVVPQFVSIIKDSGKDVPFITQLVIDISDFLKKYLMMTIGLGIVAFFVLKSYISTKDGKKVFDQVTMRLPLLGGLLIKGNLASFTNTLSTMLGSGIALIDSLEVCIDTVDNTVIAKDLEVAKNRVMEGATLTDAFKRISYFPEMVAQMLRVGEQTGKIDDMLKRISTIFEDEVSELLEDMTKLVEPIIIVFLGVGVGGIMIAMYLPIFISAE